MLQELASWNATVEIDWAWTELSRNSDLPTLYEAVVDFRSGYMLKHGLL